MLLKLIHAGASLFTLAASCLILLGATAQAQIRIVALGDSNIKGKGLLEGDAYPARLERALRAKGHNVTVANAGINGDTTKGVLSRMNSDVPQGTQIVILSVGINDTFGGVSAATVATNINTIISRLRGRNIQVLYFGAFSGQGNPTRRAELEAMGVTVVAAMQDGIIDDPNLHVETTKIAQNKYHLNSAGYDIVVARTLPQVEALIAKVK